MPSSPSGRQGGLEDPEVMGITKDLIGEERVVNTRILMKRKRQALCSPAGVQALLAACSHLFLVADLDNAVSLPKPKAKYR